MNPLLDALTEAGRQAGLTARHAISGVGGMASAFANPLALALNEGLELAGSDYRFPDQYAALQRAMTEAGLPEPQGALERGIGFASEIGVPDPTDSAKVVSSLSHMIDPQWAMTVFHGSPHKWDRVDLTKVGTGEGAQAYGHGFYAAESPDVALSYSNMRAKPDMQFYADGQLLTGLQKSIADDITANGKDIARIHAKQNGPEWLDAFNSIKDARITRGHLYELDLPDETIEKMLDWDKPLSAEVASRIKVKANGVDVAKEASEKGMTGEEVYRWLDVTFGGKDKASEYLNSIGIPGIKYLDGTSRSAGEGTRNFVVFDEQYIKPLTRNGEAIK